MKKSKIPEVEIVRAAGKVAIITRTKNRPLMLHRAIKSILGQTYKDWVHIIVDAGKPKDTEAVLAKYKKQYAGRVHVIYDNASMAAASNVGLKHSQSKYVAIHDDDDTWHPNFLTKCIAAMKKPPLGRPVRGVVCHSTMIEEQIQKDGTVKEVKQFPFNSWLRTIDLARLCASNTFPPISFLFERSLADEVGQFDGSLPGLDDWDFNIRACLAGEILILPEMLAYYHMRRDDKSIYQNSTLENKHHMHRSYLINQWIRNEHKEGRFSVAQAMAACELNYEGHRFSQRGNRFFDRLATPV